MHRFSMGNAIYGVLNWTSEPMEIVSTVHFVISIRE